MTEQRLSKALAKAGVGSRRACEELIFAGRVTVNGEVCDLPQHHVSWEHDMLAVDGRLVQGEQAKVYYLLNKPVGVLCSNKPTPSCRSLVTDLFGRQGPRLFTVGRLDKDTSGLLIVTNDGHFANRVIHPRYNIEKEYLAEVHRPLRANDLKIIAGGCTIEGCFVRPKSLRQVDQTRVRVVVMEGKNREVRRLLARAGLKTKALQRIRIGVLKLHNLPTGSWRPLHSHERMRLVGD